MKILLNHLANVFKKIITLNFTFATSRIKKCLKIYCAIYFDFFQEDKNTQIWAFFEPSDDAEGSKTPKNFMYQIWYTRSWRDMGKMLSCPHTCGHMLWHMIHVILVLYYIISIFVEISNVSSQSVTLNIIIFHIISILLFI